MAEDVRKTYRWREIAAQAKRDMAPLCWVCGKDIDRSLDKSDIWSWQLDHVIPVKDLRLMPGWPENAYDLSNLKPIHRKCNSDRAGGIIQSAKTSRVW